MHLGDGVEDCGAEVGKLMQHVQHEDAQAHVRCEVHEVDQVEVDVRLQVILVVFARFFNEEPVSLMIVVDPVKASDCPEEGHNRGYRNVNDYHFFIWK